MKTLLKIGIFSLLGVWCLFHIVSCFNDTEQADDFDTEIICHLNLTQSMLDSYSITQIRLSILQGESVIWGPKTYNVSVGSASMTGVPPGDKYIISAEALSSDGTTACSGESSLFNAVAGQTTNAGYIHLICVGFDCFFEPSSVNPTFTADEWRWNFDWGVRESKGTAVQLQVCIIEFYTLQGTEPYSSNDFAGQFNDWFGTSTLPAFGELRTDNWFWHHNDGSGTGWKMRWIYRGQDSNGNAMESICWVTLNNSSNATSGVENNFQVTPKCEPK